MLFQKNDKIALISNGRIIDLATVSENQIEEEGEMVFFTNRLLKPNSTTEVVDKVVKIDDDVFTQFNEAKAEIEKITGCVLCPNDD
jgi:hypothetical protein